MDQSVIMSIKEDLGRIAETKDAETVHLLIQGINRNIRKLDATGNVNATVLTRLGLDLLESYKSEKAFMELSGKKKVISEGFYRSFTVLRKDMEKALEQPGS